MVMYAPYRCCECPEPPRCCELWCECPEEITVSFCKRERSHELIACAGPGCHPAPGTVVGSSLTTVDVNGVKFRKVTGLGPISLCDPCCWYQLVTGEDQTGTISFSVDDSLLYCAEKDGDECSYGYLTCVGSKTMQLSGNTSVFNLAMFSGYLVVDCCNPQTCEADTLKARLSLTIQAVHSDHGNRTDCCTQQTTDLSTTVQFSADYFWECRHRTRWEGTCPADLLDEPGNGSVYWFVTGCTVGDGEPCPCGSTSGQGSDYVATCIVDPPAIQYCVQDYGETVTCTPSGNGIIESIT